MGPKRDKQWGGWMWDADLYWHNEWDWSTKKQYCIMYMLTKDWTVLKFRVAGQKAHHKQILQSSTPTGPERPFSGLQYPLPPDSGSVCCSYLILTFWTDPHAFRNGFQGWIQAVQVINTRTRVAHEQLATASAHSAEILMDVSLWGRIGPISFPTNHQWRGKAGEAPWSGLVYSLGLF